MQEAFVCLVGHSLDWPTLCRFGCLICLGGITSSMLRWVQVPAPPSPGRNRAIQEYKYHERKDWKKIEVESRSTRSLRLRWNFVDFVVTPDIEDMSLAARRLNTRPWTYSIAACWSWGSRSICDTQARVHGTWRAALPCVSWTHVNLFHCSLLMARLSAVSVTVKHASMEHGELPFCVFLLKRYLLQKSPRHYSKKQMRLNRINCSWNHRNE
jgi:hypothetical protein